MHYFWRVVQVQKMKAMDQPEFSGYKCTNTSYRTCNTTHNGATTYASDCSSADGYYRYDDYTKKIYRCTQFRNGEEYANAVTGQTMNIYLCY